MDQFVAAGVRQAVARQERFRPRQDHYRAQLIAIAENCAISPLELISSPVGPASGADVWPFDRPDAH